MKKFLAAMLSVVLLAGSVTGLNVNAAEALPENNQQQIVAEGGSNPSNGELNSDGVSVSKVITATDKENYFDITLTAKTTKTMDELVQAQTTDVVIVMDISDTMGTKQSDGKTRLKNAKEAANTFIELYCKETELGKRNITLVTFNTNAKKVFTENNVSSSNISTLKSQVNSVKTAADSGADDGERFTNVEAGLRLARNILSASSAQNKFVIFLSDGFPTTYIKSNETSKSQIKGYDATTLTYSASNVGKDGYFLDSVLKQPAKYGTNYSNKAAIRAREEATRLKEIADVFSVGIDIGGQSIQTYIDQSEKAANISDKFSTMDRTGTSYEIGTTTKAYTNWLKNKIAGGANLSEDNATRYCDGNDEAALKAAYKNILKEIKSIFYKQIEDAYIVADPMGSQVEFLNFYKKDGTVVSSLSGSHAENAESTASFSKDTINWNFLKSGYTTEQSGNTTIYTYQVKYKVRLENEATGFVEGQTYNTNGTAKLNYKVNSNGVLSSEKSLNFPIPSVKGYLGELNISKVSSLDGTVLLPGATFELKHNSDCSVCDGKVTISKQTATTDGNGALSFTGIPSGHEYTLTEKTAPSGYIKDTTTHTVKVAYDKVYLDGEDVTAGAVISNEPFAPATYQITASKAMKGGSAPEAGKYSFVLKDASGAEIQTVTNDASGAIAFDKLTFDAAGTYNYTVTEKLGDDQSIIYDESIYNVAIVVGVNDAQTAYEIKSVSTTKDGVAASVRFTNKSRDSVDVELTGTKTMDGEVPEADAFTFELKDKDGNVIQTVANDAAGKVTFKKLTFDAVGTYEYTVSEDNAEDEDVVYDKTEYKVVITVSYPDNNYDAYIADVKITNNGEDDAVEFENATRNPAEVVLTASKTMEGETPADGAYSFTLTGKDDEGQDISMTKTNDGNGLVTFDTMYFDNAGTYEYTISEVRGVDPDTIYDRDVYTAIVKVSVPEDGGDTFVAEVSYEKNGEAYSDDNVTVPFENTSREHAFVPVEATKTMDGEPAEEGAYTFVLEPSELNQNDLNERQEVANGEDGLVTFEDLEFGAEGTYIYTVYEVKGDNEQIVYDKEVYTMTVVVTAPGEDSETPDGEYLTDVTIEPAIAESADAMTFANATREKAVVELEALKKLDGEASKTAFSFELKDKDGKVVQTKENDANGKVVFDALEFDKSGTYTYTISEVNAGAANVKYDKSVYTVTIEVTADTDSAEAFQAAVTVNKDGNAYEGTIEFQNETTVDTGDHSNIGLWVFLAALSGAIVLVTFVMKRKRRA